MAWVVNQLMRDWNSARVVSDRWYGCCNSKPWLFIARVMDESTESDESPAWIEIHARKYMMPSVSIL
jgi:hypothetical protein